MGEMSLKWSVRPRVRVFQSTTNGRPDFRPPARGGSRQCVDVVLASDLAAPRRRAERSASEMAAIQSAQTTRRGPAAVGRGRSVTARAARSPANSISHLAISTGVGRARLGVAAAPD